MPRILTIEDDAATANEIARELTSRGYQVDLARMGEEALSQAASKDYAALTLDRMLPDMDGLEVARRLRERGVWTPILMISALDEVDERIRGLRAGGDDYLIKPFALEEMAARVEVLVRRARADEERHRLRWADLELDLVAQEAQREGRRLHLSPKELKLLEYFLRHPGQALTRTMIFQAVWGYAFDPGTNLIDVHIRALRQKLGTDGERVLQTVRGAGYRLGSA